MTFLGPFSVFSSPSGVGPLSSDSKASLSMQSCPSTFPTRYWASIMDKVEIPYRPLSPADEYIVEKAFEPPTSTKTNVNDES